jgi:predicted enzyme related to lactoylglutathione lyase
MSRPVHFEIMAADPARAVEFYTKVFGWQIHKWEGGDQDYWLVTTGRRVQWASMEASPRVKAKLSR